MLTRAAANEPITTAEAKALFAPLRRFSHLLLAVSGGADSLAMMVLVAAWLKQSDGAKPRVSVASVDHGLRPEAGEEAAYVGGLARQFGFDHASLRWEGDKPSAGLQEAAREARLALLTEHARTIGADALMLAHHANDQAETLLMRLCAGSGLTGLGGMEPETQWQGHVIVRPFLSIPRERLRASLESAGIQPIEDPSNQNVRFTRVRFRNAMAQLEAEGLDRVRLGRLAQRMRRADEALHRMAERARDAYELPSETGARFAAALWDEPEEIILRVISNHLASLHHGKPVELLSLEDVHKALQKARFEGVSARRTLAGALITLAADGVVAIQLEAPRRTASKD